MSTSATHSRPGPAALRDADGNLISFIEPGFKVRDLKPLRIDPTGLRWSRGDMSDGLLQVFHARLKGGDASHEVFGRIHSGSSSSSGGGSE